MNEKQATGVTAGPWRTENNYVTANVGKILIAQISRVLVDNDGEVAANARAIAAVPDMIEALRQADATLTAEDGCNIAPIIGSDNPHERAAGLVRAALAKAVQSESIA